MSAVLRLTGTLLLLWQIGATGAHAAGFRAISMLGDPDGSELVGGMWYPCAEPPSDVDLGPLVISATKDCPIRGRNLPLVVMSHGNVGNFFDHHDTAAALADAGFVVAAITHRGDNSPPTFAAGADPSVMPGRPADMTRLLDFMIGSSAAAAHIDPERVGFFGFSAGGFTGLVLLGARPDWPAVLCRFSAEMDSCIRILRSQFRTIERDPEPRIKAAVLADPAGMWLDTDSVASVRIPIQLWASETGGEGLSSIARGLPEAAAAIAQRLPAGHEYRVVPNAGHFAFMLCGPSINQVAEFCADAPGFDRVEFHEQFNAEVVRFFAFELKGRD